MRKLPIFALITSGATIGVISFAVARQRMRQCSDHGHRSQNNISGEITDIKGINLKIKDEAGQIHPIKVIVTELLVGLNIGDSVDVELEKGQGISIRKIKTKPAEDNSETIPTP